MRLFEKGEISFVFLWVLNPIVILFYQNCSPSHLSQASTQNNSGMEKIEMSSQSPDSVSSRCLTPRLPCMER